MRQNLAKDKPQRPDLQVPVACLSVLFCTIKSRVKCVEVFLIQSILYDAQGFTEISNLSKCLQTQCLSGVEGVLNFWNM